MFLVNKFEIHSYLKLWYRLVLKL